MDIIRRVGIIRKTKKACNIKFFEASTPKQSLCMPLLRSPAQQGFCNCLIISGSLTGIRLRLKVIYKILH